MTQYVEKTSSNARIHIDYKGKKPEVKFSYPGEKRPVTLHWILGLFIAALLLISLQDVIGISLRPIEIWGLLATTTLLFGAILKKPVEQNYGKIFIKVGTISGEEHYSKVFKEVPKQKYVEIPLFKNMFLDYEATKDFSKYLTDLKITEHPFKAIEYRRKKRISKPNEYLWRARFYFSKIPKEGMLEVKWR